MKMVTFNSFCDTACMKFKLLYNITTGYFQSRPRFGEQYYFDQMNEFCTSQGSVVAFSDALDKTEITYVNFSGLLYQKLLKIRSF